MRGPPTAGGVPELTSVRARRYECQSCGACMLVVPRELLARRLYTASAIGFALALWALVGATESAVRTRVSPLAFVGTAAQGSWVTLRRWATATAEGLLFATASSRAPPARFSRRQQAERAAASLVALAPPGSSVEVAAFAGGALHPR